MWVAMAMVDLSNAKESLNCRWIFFQFCRYLRVNLRSSSTTLVYKKKVAQWARDTTSVIRKSAVSKGQKDHGRAHSFCLLFVKTSTRSPATTYVSAHRTQGVVVVVDCPRPSHLTWSGRHPKASRRWLLVFY